MAYVSFVEKDAAAEGIRPVYDKVAKATGQMLNMFKAMAHSPEAFQSFLAFDGAYATKMTLDPKLRELAYLKASDLNHCTYCLHYHRKFGAKAGLSERQMDEITNFETSD